MQVIDAPQVEIFHVPREERFPSAKIKHGARDTGDVGDHQLEDGRQRAQVPQFALFIEQRAWRVGPCTKQSASVRESVCVRESCV